MSDILNQGFNVIEKWNFCPMQFFASTLSIQWTRKVILQKKKKKRLSDYSILDAFFPFFPYVVTLKNFKLTEIPLKISLSTFPPSLSSSLRPTSLTCMYVYAHTRTQFVFLLHCVRVSQRHHDCSTLNTSTSVS